MTPGVQQAIGAVVDDCNLIAILSMKLKRSAEVFDAALGEERARAEAAEKRVAELEKALAALKVP